MNIGGSLLQKAHTHSTSDIALNNSRVSVDDTRALPEVSEDAEHVDHLILAEDVVLEL